MKQISNIDIPKASIPDSFGMTIILCWNKQLVSIILPDFDLYSFCSTVTLTYNYLLTTIK
jgi:hypothetical protein